MYKYSKPLMLGLGLGLESHGLGLGLGLDMCGLVNITVQNTSSSTSARFLQS